jgi:cell wall-associated NlpC family hydrolase
MRGSSTHHSMLRYIALLVIASAALASIATPAAAHEKGNFKKARKHIKRRVASAKGSPYSYGGTSKSGFDCSGLTTWVFRGHGANLPRTSLAQFYIPKHRPRARRVWKKRNLKKGDLVFHKTTGARVGHVGIYVGNGKFISTTSSRGVRAQSIRDPYYWGPRFVGAVRVANTRRKYG